MNIFRIAAGILAALHGINGAAMIIAPGQWYLTAPGVTATGPFNPHFVVDIGFIFLMSGVAFGLWAWRPALGTALVCMAAAWPALHAGFHFIHLGHVAPAILPLEIGGVIFPGLAGAAIAWAASRKTGD